MADDNLEDNIEQIQTPNETGSSSEQSTHN